MTFKIAMLTPKLGKKRKKGKKGRKGKKKGNSKRTDKIGTIVPHLLNCKGKINILKNVKNLKGKSIFINESFSQETIELRKELCEKVKKK